MARPIEPTPPLEGEDAQRLLRDLESGCTREEWQSRVSSARSQLAELLRPRSRTGDASGGT